MQLDREVAADLLERLPDPLVVAWTEAKGVWCNAAARRLLGPGYGALLRPEGAARCGVFLGDERTPASDPLCLPNPHDAGWAAEPVVHELFVRNAGTPTGRHVTLRCILLPETVGGRPDALLLFGDRVEHKRAQVRLARSARLLADRERVDTLARLAMQVAGEFQHLMGDTLREVAAFEGQAAAAGLDASPLARIRAGAEQARSLTKTLVRMGELRLPSADLVDLNEVVAGARSVVQRLLGSDVELIVRSGKAPAFVRVAVHDVEQILAALAANARDAMPHGGRVTLETRLVDLEVPPMASCGPAPTGLQVELTMADTGCGIPSEHRVRIFDPFFTTKSGTGLGLTLVASLVARNAGALCLDSAIGIGTSFRIYFPAVQPREREEEVRASLVPSEDVLAGCTVLVLEPDVAVRATMMQSLRAAGAQLLEAAHRADARALCASHHGKIDVAILALSEGDADGTALADALQSMRPDLRVLLLSSFPEGHLGDEPMRMHLSRPLAPGRLSAAVAAARAGEPLVNGGGRTSPSAGVVAGRILVVDDDPTLRDLIRRWLEHAGFVVELAGDGQEASKVFAAGRFDAVVSDIQMPGCGGMELLRRLRRIDLDIPIVLLTGAPDVDSAAGALEDGAFRYLTKPIAAERLVEVVRHAVRAHALARLRRQAMAATGRSDRSAADRAGLEVRLDAALEALDLAFQPIWAVRQRKVYGFEALLRTREASFAGPLEVIEAARRLGRLRELGGAIRHRALEALARLPSHVALFLNLHPDELHDPALLEPDSLLASHASRIVFELTEHRALATTQPLRARIARLRELGFRLAIDDIGAGYSGLNTFADVIPEIVKIDRALIEGIYARPVQQRTVRLLCEMCRDMGTLVVAEGIEVAEERDVAVELGCDLLQGYLLGRPGPLGSATPDWVPAQ